MEGGDDELLAVLLLNVSTDRIITRFALQGGVAIGWDDGGEEVARVPLREPVILRPAYDGALGAYRYNVP
jgi:nitrate reductase beta subunit